MKEKYRHPQFSTKGLVAYYKLLAGLTSTAKVFDYTLNGLTGVPSGTDIAPAYPGFKFNGTDDLITVPDNPLFDFSTSLSVCAWIKPDTVASLDGIVSKYITVGDLREWSFTLATPAGNDAPITVFIGNSGGTAATSEGTTDDVISTNTWRLVGFTYNAGTVIIYVDGVAVSSTESAPHVVSLSNENTDVIIGSHNVTNMFDGCMGETLIYGSVLTPAEVKSIYELTKWRYPNNN